MSIFDMHKAVIDDYRQYVQSFISIADPEIRRFVEQELTDSRRLWPEPLIQLNPEYQATGTGKMTRCSYLLSMNTNDPRDCSTRYSRLVVLLIRLPEASRRVSGPPSQSQQTQQTPFP
jgi:hypothetical protein